MKEVKEKSKPFHRTVPHDKIQEFPKIIYKDIVKDKPHKGIKNELYPTAILDCPRKEVLMKWLHDLGYEEVVEDKKKWYPYRGNVWDDHLSNLFEENGGHSQVSVMVVVPITDRNGQPEDVVLIRGRIDAIYKEDNKWKLVDFKTTNEYKLFEDKHIEDKYVAQISFYSKIMNIEEFGLFFATNAAPSYEKYVDESGVLRTYTYDRMVQRAQEIYTAYKNGYLPEEKREESCPWCPFRDVCHRLINSPYPKETMKKYVEEVLLDTGKVKKKEE